jgi:hypothetical protein
MTAQIFQAIEQRIKTEVSAVELIDWFANQYDDSDLKDFAWITPAVFIEFTPCTWLQSGNFKIQETTLTIRIHTVTDNNFPDSKRFTTTDHLKIQDAIHTALQGWDCLLSYVPDYAMTTNDYLLINEMTRTASIPEHQLRPLTVTINEYQAEVYDLSMIQAQPIQTVENVTIQLDIHKTDHLN